ncbi:MAG: hypothetical protein KBT31_02820 [Firmicutes bacterium]|nr:hypothetical protein [Candidatus Colimorpha enterica]
MKLKKPIIEFVEIDKTDVITTSGCPENVELSQGSTSTCKNTGASMNGYEAPDCQEAGSQYT